MKAKYLIIIIPTAKPNIIGTWRLLSGTEITNGVKIVTDYTKDYRAFAIDQLLHDFDT